MAAAVAAEGNVEGGRQEGDAGGERGTRWGAARALGRVCVRLINQTLAFGVLPGEREREREERERQRRGVGNCKRRRTRRMGRRKRESKGTKWRKRRRRRCRPGRVEHEAEPGQAKPSRTK